jgi:hypothetical protein
VAYGAVLLEDPAKRSVNRVQDRDQAETINLLKIPIAVHRSAQHQDI